MEEVRDSRWGDFKPRLAEALVEHLAPIRTNYAEIMKDPVPLAPVHCESPCDSPTVYLATQCRALRLMHVSDQHFRPPQHLSSTRRCCCLILSDVLLHAAEIPANECTGVPIRGACTGRGPCKRGGRPHCQQLSPGHGIPGAELTSGLPILQRVDLCRIGSQSLCLVTGIGCRL